MRYMTKSPIYHTVWALLPIVAACSSDARSNANAQGVADTIGGAPRITVIQRSSTLYHMVLVPNPGTVTGVVQFDGTPSGDMIIQVSADQNGCGKPLTIRRLERTNGNVANVVVWLTDVRAGEALPSARRFELENNDCQWTPVVQTTLVGGTLNVINSDPLAERAFATDVATGDTVADAPFTDDGQLIPYDRLMRSPGVYEFSVESRPMSRAWIAVFDQPYFAVTKGDGSFSIDGVPAGTHTVRAWHPLLGVADGSVTVAAGGSASLTLRFK